MMKNLFENSNSKSIVKHQIKVPRARENIVPPKAMKKVFLNVFDDLSRMIKYTIGPAGGNTLVTEPYASTPIYPTKDGFTVMNNHIYDNPTYESIYRIVRDISGRTNQELGDATTSSVVIAADFYKRITHYLSRHKEITPYGAKNLLDSVLTAITNGLKENNYIAKIDTLPKKEKIEIYRKIATIAANNDSSIADVIAEAYDKAHTEHPFIDVQKSYNAETTVDTDVGFEIPYGYNINYMANAADSRRGAPPRQDARVARAEPHRRRHDRGRAHRPAVHLPRHGRRRRLGRVHPRLAVRAGAIHSLCADTRALSDDADIRLAVARTR